MSEKEVPLPPYWRLALIDQPSYVLPVITQYPIFILQIRNFSLVVSTRNNYVIFIERTLRSIVLFRFHKKKQAVHDHWASTFFPHKAPPLTLHITSASSLIVV